MLNLLTIFFDPYDRKARLQPALLSLLPAFIVFALLIPEFNAVWAVISGIVFYCGSSTLATQFGRDRGKRIEPALYRSWGGKPSVAMLRHSDTRLARSTKDRYRGFLKRSVPGLNLASPDEERTCSAHADDGYESATAWLLAQTRDRGRFGLIFRENVNYGFRRNIWGLKPLAFVIDGASMVILAVIAEGAWTGQVTTTLESVDTFVWVSVVVLATHFIAFTFLIRRDWVRTAADAYAQQLLAACDTLDGRQPIRFVTDGRSEG